MRKERNGNSSEVKLRLSRGVQAGSGPLVEAAYFCPLRPAGTRAVCNKFSRDRASVFMHGYTTFDCRPVLGQYTNLTAGQYKASAPLSIAGQYQDGTPTSTQASTRAVNYFRLQTSTRPVHHFRLQASTSPVHQPDYRPTHQRDKLLGACLF